jgi:hypothetical protein
MSGDPSPSGTIERCSVQPDGFLSLSESTAWRLGAVLFARRSNAFAVVRKAPVSGGGYEFAGLHVLPGGMARASRSSTWETGSPRDILKESLLDRVRREVGLTDEDLQDPVFAPVGPIVSSYTAKGSKRFTLIVPFTSEVGSAASLQVSDRSVDDASWMPIPPAWESLAPGNLVAIAHTVWNEMDEGQRAAARPLVDGSARRCSEWAGSIGVAPVPPPWASRDEISEWCASWPC